MLLKANKKEGLKTPLSNTTTMTGRVTTKDKKVPAKGRFPSGKHPLKEEPHSAKLKHLMLDSSKTCICLGKVPESDPKFGNFRLVAVERSELVREMYRSKPLGNYWTANSEDCSLAFTAKVPLGKGIMDFMAYWLPLISGEQRVTGVVLVVQKKTGEPRIQALPTRAVEDSMKFRFQLGLMESSEVTRIEVYANVVEKGDV